MGSSNSGAGNTGLNDGTPVPEGPPPPTLFLVRPLTLAAAAMAACCFAKTSLPLVT